MKRTLRLSIPVTAFTASLLVVLLLGWGDTDLHAQQVDAPTPTPTSEPGPVSNVLPGQEGKVSPPRFPNLDADLNRVVERAQASGLVAAAEGAQSSQDKPIAVTLYVEEGYADAIESYLEASGASPRNTGADYIEAYVPVSLLAEVSKQEGVVSIRAIISPSPAQGTIVSGGAEVHGVPSWHTAGYEGSGVKIGVIDLSFKGFAELQGNELPSAVSARCYTEIGKYTSDISDCDNTGLPERTRLHGTAVAEAVFDVAPDATYYIANPSSWADLLSATTWMVGQGVDVINMSLGWTFAGPGDGTSRYSNAPVKSVDAAVTGGVIWVNAAGNSARDSWHGTFTDSDSDDILEFNSSKNECNGVTVSLKPLESLTAQLRWDDSWNGASKDLDLYMISKTSNTLSLSNAVRTSASSQTGESEHTPYEQISIVHGEIENGEYCFAVRKASGDAPSWVQLLIWGNTGTLQNYVSEHSIGDPADSKNSGMLAVGAARHSSTSTIEPFSSQGPTMDDRKKPDIVGADGGKSKTYGAWYGTSQASPYVAGLAALVKQRFPTYTPAQIASYMKTNALARGATQPNNIWGHGFAKLPAIPTSTAANLSGLNITGTVERSGETRTFRLLSNPWFDSDTAEYTIRVPSDLQSITFTAAWTDTAITAVALKERGNADSNTQNSSEAARTTSSGTSLTSGASPRFPAIEVIATSGDPQVHYFNLQPISLSFGSATVDDSTYTEGHEISLLGFSEAEKDAIRLPVASGGFYNVTYTATGLPEGLYLGQGRLIQGTPAQATTIPAEVDYTATDDIGASVTLHFHVSVAPAVVFDADERQVFKDTIFEYTVGQTDPINATLPEATGGHGTLTYGLTYRVKEQRTVDGRQITGGVVKTINDDAPGFSFDSATRVLSSDTGSLAPSAPAFYSVDYWAEDENGARAIASNSIAVNEAPSLPEVADRRFTVGDNVSVTLPKAVGGTQVGIGLQYRLEPAVEGLVLNGRQHVRSLTGRPTVPGTTEVTYTATDRNGVSASRTFTINVVNGPSAPSSAPSSVQAAQVYSGADPNGSGAAATWNAVSGATGYVVQVISDGGSYPDLAINSAPADVNLSLPNLDSGLVWINAISTGDYKIRVAAKNEDGVGPWSGEVSFTVSGATQQPADGQDDTCDNCGTGGDEGVVAQGQGQYAELIAKMYEWRNDSQWSSYKEHTDRWDRALLAFGEVVSDATLTPMTAAEAQGFADRGSAWSRWVEVAAALRELEDGAQQPQPVQDQQPTNRAPTVSAVLGDLTIVSESRTMQVSLSGVFADADNDPLTVTAGSSNEAAATVAVVSDGSSLTVTAKARGTATVSVRADDGKGGTADDSFTVTVKAAPVVASALADVSGLEAGDTRDVSLSGVFSDADGDPLTVTAASSDDAVATVSAAADHSVLTIIAVAEGTATITVTAQDSDGNRVSDTFEVSVSKVPEPEPTPTPTPTPGPTPTPEPEPEMSDIVARYDSNGDGKIDESEWQKAKSDFAAGKITYGELLEIIDAYLGAG